MSKDPAPPHDSSEMLSPRDPDCAFSLEDGAETEIVVKGSRFIGQALRIDDDGEPNRRVEAVRRKTHDATHHCWAFRCLQVSVAAGVRRETLLERWDDDGEPSGTAGIPILGALHRAGLDNALVIVTRYFGGTKLGPGRLARAYGDAAREAVQRAPKREIWRLIDLRVTCTYESLGAVEAFLTRNHEMVRNIQREFTEQPGYVLGVLQSRADEFRASLVETTAGRVTILP